MSALVADTHAVIWYLLSSPRLSSTALQRMEQTAHEGDAIYIASISLVEIVYLVERGRVPADLLNRVVTALQDSRSALVLAPLDLSVATSIQRIPRAQIPEMPDRIIAATAVALNLPLVTRDTRMQLPNLTTIW